MNSIARSDTFIREEEEKASGMNKKEREAEEKDQIFLDPEKIKSNTFLKKIAELQECAYDVISKIDQVKKVGQMIEWIIDIQQITIFNQNRRNFSYCL